MQTVEWHTHNKDSHSCPKEEPKEDIWPVVFVVWDATETCVESHHEEHKLQEGAEQPWGLKLKPHLDVYLEGRTVVKATFR